MSKIRKQNEPKLRYRMGREVCDGKNHYVIWMGPVFSLPEQKEFIGKCTCKKKGGKKDEVSCLQ